MGVSEFKPKPTKLNIKWSKLTEVELNAAFSSALNSDCTPQNIDELIDMDIESYFNF